MTLKIFSALFCLGFIFRLGLITLNTAGYINYFISRFLKTNDFEIGNQFS